MDTLTSGPVTLYLAAAHELGAAVFEAPVAPSSAPSSAELVACGPMFSGGRPDYLLRAPGAYAPSRYPTRGATVSVRDGVATVHRGAVDDAPVSVQGYPALIVDGAVVTSPDVDAETVGRVALVVMRDGRVGIAVATIPMDRFARLILAAGAIGAVYLDGGSSTFVRAPGRTIGQGARRLPSFVTLGANHGAASTSTGDGLGIAVALAILAASRRRARR